MGFSAVRCFALLITFVILSLLPPSTVLAQSTNVEGLIGHYNVGIFVSSDNDGCYIPGGVRAIKQLTNERAREINETGGINGRELRLKFMDELDDVKNTKRLVDGAVADRDLIAMIGLNSSTRGAQVVDKIGRSGIPLISEMSRNDLYAPYANIFALTAAIDDEFGVVKKFIEDGAFSKPVFVGQKGNLYLERIEEALTEPQSPKPMMQSHWLEISPDYSIADMLEADRIIDELSAAEADFIFLAIHSGPGAQFLARLLERKEDLPVYVLIGSLGRIQQMMVRAPYPQDIYKSIRGNAPYVFNERLRQRIWRTNDSQNWLFPSLPSPNPPAKCATKRAPKPLTGVGDSRNFRTINFAVRYRDMLGLIADVAQIKDVEKDPKTIQGLVKVPAIRTRVIKGLAHLKQGERIYRGWWHNWSFTKNRAVAENSFVVHLDPKIGEMALSPTQYQLTPTGLKPVPVVYISIDMVRIFDVNSNQESFQSEFYLSFKSNGKVDIGDIEFTNAFRAQFNTETLINIRPIHSNDGSGPLPLGLKLYKITGKFMFNPDLRRYPFDKQRFSISFQPSNAANPFIIQPPPETVIQSEFESDGWRPETRYVGSDQDIISIIGDHVSQQKIIPLYKFNFTWTHETYCH